MIGKGKTKGREAAWEVVAVTQVRHAADLDQGDGSGDKWMDTRDIWKVESIKLSDAFQRTGPVCLLPPIKTLPIFRLKCSLFHKIFCILPEPFSAFSNVHSNLCIFLVSLDFRVIVYV